jgi:iron complex transport system ATP-binding protein
MMHDLNLTTIVADRVTVHSDGRVAEAGTADSVLRDDLLSEVYGCPVRLGVVPDRGIFVPTQAGLDAARRPARQGRPRAQTA